MFVLLRKHGLQCWSQLLQPQQISLQVRQLLIPLCHSTRTDASSCSQPMQIRLRNWFKHLVLTGHQVRHHDCTVKISNGQFTVRDTLSSCISCQWQVYQQGIIITNAASDNIAAAMTVHHTVVGLLPEPVYPSENHHFCIISNFKMTSELTWVQLMENKVAII